VAYDFLRAEWPAVVEDGIGQPGSLMGGAQDYLYEAALAGSPPSGAFYDPEGDGIPLESLGVHEHWDNAEEKRYSRNLGTGLGIELVSSDPAATLSCKGDWDADGDVDGLDLTAIAQGQSQVSVSVMADELGRRDCHHPHVACTRILRIPQCAWTGYSSCRRLYS
jgi:hypothetical protein